MTGVKKYGAFLVLLATILCLAGFAYADVAVDETHFPDAGFRTYIGQAGMDGDGNGVLSGAELQQVTNIDCSERDIRDLTGIEHFTELTVLCCDFNPLRSLNLQKNTKLTTLSCHSCELQSLNLSANSKLTFLGCTGNQLKNLDLSRNTQLEKVWCGSNELQSLITGKNKRLKELGCAFNELKSLDLSECPALVKILKTKAPSDEGSFWYYGTEIEIDKTVVVSAGDSIFGPEPYMGLQFTLRGMRFEITDTDCDLMSFLGLVKPGSMVTVRIPDTVTYNQLSYRVNSIAADAMRKDKKITTLLLGNGVSSICDRAFASCVKLKTVKGTNLYSIGRDAFSGCKALKTFLPMKKLKYINQNAFKGDKSLTAFTLSGNLVLLGKNAFSGCTSLKTFTVLSGKLTARILKAGAFSGISKKAVFICPKGKAAAYKTLFVKKGAPKTCKFR